jgi:hypothetical protein
MGRAEGDDGESGDVVTTAALFRQKRLMLPWPDYGGVLLSAIGAIMSEPKESGSTVVDFRQAGEKHRHARMHDEKEAKVEAMRERFAAALPDKKTPVKDYLKKKRAKKKR